MRLRITASVLSAGVLASCLTGCGDPDPVRTYQVAKPVADDSFVPSPGSGGPVAQAPVAWFFKLTGPAAAVVGQAESFTRLVSSVQFGADGKPSWSLPKAGPSGRNPVCALPRSRSPGIRNWKSR